MRRRWGVTRHPVRRSASRHRDTGSSAGWGGTVKGMALFLSWVGLFGAIVPRKGPFGV